MKNLLQKSMVVGCLLLCNVIMASSSESGPPRIATHPKVRTGICGQDVMWKVKAIGKPEPAFSAFYEDNIIKNGGRYTKFSKGNEYSLIITDITIEDAGDYRFTFTNEYGEASTTVPFYVRHF